MPQLRYAIKSALSLLALSATQFATAIVSFFTPSGRFEFRWAAIVINKSKLKACMM